MITSNSKLKHLMHCTLFFAILAFFVIFKNDIKTSKLDKDESLRFKPPRAYDTLAYLVSLGCRLLVFLSLPYAVITSIGLTFFNAFPEDVLLQDSSVLTPLLCIRIVTRGDYPELVRETVARNMATLAELNAVNFTIEVVTDKSIGLPRNRKIREIVVPASYAPKSGARYKARALQYCLEDEVNTLADSDYIVHLDEETIMTRNSVYGIVNFVNEGKYDFGQGTITYANDFVVNWITTLADCKRVAGDMGRIRGSFELFRKPLFSWKGSYMVAKVSAERDVSFDHGIAGSVTEDSYFALTAIAKDYKFAFIDGEMWERSTFTIWDFIRQRKRWLQGELLVLHSPRIAWSYKIWWAFTSYASLTLPLSWLELLLNPIFPPSHFWLSTLCSFVQAVNIYTYLFGALKSLSLQRLGILKYSLAIVATLLVIPTLALIMENIVALLVIFNRKTDFYVVDKNITAIEERNLKIKKG